jgi:hypothetical protein
MSSPHWFRFTLGQLMAVTAFFAMRMAAAISERHLAGPGISSTFADPKYWLATGVRFAGVGVCLYNLRLSRGMWLVLVGYVGPWLSGLATGLTIAVWYSAPNATFPVNVARAGWAANHLLFSSWGLL